MIFMPVSRPQQAPADTVRLLIVEDEAIVAMDLSSQLQDMGYTVVGVADNGADALELARTLRPDLVLMDVMIKGPMDGIEAASEMTSRYRSPVIFLTAFNDLAMVRRAAETGPYGYINKPFQVKELRPAIEVSLAKSRTDRALLAQVRLDPLTGMPNRAGINAELTDWLARGQRQGRGFALLFMDLDFFKQANDAHGHAGGDQILRTVAQRLRHTLRDVDMVGRWAGDEFVALLDNVVDADDVHIVARKLRAQMQGPIALDNGASASIGLSIGVALYPTDGAEADALLRRADEALYRAKAQGRGRLCFYCEGMDDTRRSHYVAAQELAWALDDMALELTCSWYTTRPPGAPRAVHAALSWVDPAGRPWPERQLHALAHEAGLTVQFDAWTLRQACAEAAARSADAEGPAVSVRVGVSTVRSGELVGLVQSALSGASLQPQRLVVEVPASLLIDANGPLLNTLKTLSAEGVGLSVHDAGREAINPGALRRLAPQDIHLSPLLLPGPVPTNAALEVIDTWVCLALGTGAVAVAPEDTPAGWHTALRSVGCWVPGTPYPHPVATPASSI